MLCRYYSIFTSYCQIGMHKNTGNPYNFAQKVSISDYQAY